VLRQFDALDPDAALPACAPQARLKLPRQKIQQKNFQAADEHALFAAAHAFDVLGDIQDVGVVQPA
jgi:hypothetical protein